MSGSWSDVPHPLLQAILLAALPETLSFPPLLLPGTPEAAEAAAQLRTIAAFRATCSAWATAGAAALQSPALLWSVAVQRPAAAAAALQPQLEQLAVAALDLRRLTWAEAGGSVVAEALLTSAAFRRRSAGCLHTALGVPERLCAALAAGFPSLHTVGLCEDYASTERKAHSAPMQLAPLRGLARLRRLQLELGVVDLAGVPPQVRELRLTEIDRLVVPPPPLQPHPQRAQQQGCSLADRLLAAAAHAGLERLRLESAAGSAVFEEANQAPLELDVGHLTRLCQAAGAGRWRVVLDVTADAALGQRRLCLQLVRV